MTGPSPSWRPRTTWRPDRRRCPTPRVWIRPWGGTAPQPPRPQRRPRRVQTRRPAWWPLSRSGPWRGGRPTRAGCGSSDLRGRHLRGRHPGGPVAPVRGGHRLDVRSGHRGRPFPHPRPDGAGRARPPPSPTARWVGPVPSDLGPGANRQVQAWAQAYADGDAATLYRLTGDTRSDTYPSLQGWRLRPGDGRRVRPVKAGVALAQVQVVMHEVNDPSAEHHQCLRPPARPPRAVVALRAGVGAGRQRADPGGLPERPAGFFVAGPSTGQS